MKHKQVSERVLRKALLQAHAQIQRYELERQIEDVQLAATPRSLVQGFLPGLVGEGDGSRPGPAWTRVGTQLAGLYRQYPLLASTVLKSLERGGSSRALRFVGIGMAIFKAIRMLRGR